MTKFEIIRLRAEMISDMLNSYSYSIDSIPSRISQLKEAKQEQIEKHNIDENCSCDTSYYDREIEEAEMRLQIYNEIVKHLEKMF